MVLARCLVAAGVLVLVAGIAPDANAQQIYKIVGPDGRVTFSDQPPATGPTGNAAPVAVRGSGGANLAGLPFELRQAAGRYPVTLYTSPGCNTCATGRSMLMARGIPFAEKTVTTNEDSEAFKRMGATTVPVLTIGSQQLRGYSDIEWAQFLDAAGYPRTSQLPPSYVPSPATPLVALDDSPRTPAPTRQATAAPTGRTAAPTEMPTENPAGIRF
ncbi:glutaredoxin domain-containing protein [Ramlibacter tataouinensis]|uniref:glutaredoxin domain-containing protein n=1 Tax=Ramlibacter tataouinensis TaxID=94132 RepID=UPI000777BE77|nr:glutaredoxin domain-containing protein [Ramlibacter tataouinensis]